jgi:serine protease Do
VNTRGEVIGINNAIASENGYYQGYGFAVPITLAKKVMDDLIAHGRVQFGVLGVQVGPVDADAAAVAKLPSVSGALVSGFSPDDASNPARKAGMQEGDVIVAIDGQPVDKVSTLQRIVRFHEPGETLKVDAIRYGKRMTFDVKLAPRPSDTQIASTTGSTSVSPTSTSGAKLGVTLTTVPSGAERQQADVPANLPSAGAFVADVAPLGPSFSKLAQGDIITEVLYPTPRRPVNSPTDLINILNGMKKGDYISLNVAYADGQGGVANRIVNIRLGS